MAVDLHIHTNVSDGIYTPEEIVHKALQASLTAIAITDHDTIEGIAPAQIAAQQHSLEIVPGIELSAAGKHGDVHILGYYINLDDQEFLAHLAAIRTARIERITQIMAKFAKLGITFDISELIDNANKIALCRSHLAHAMIVANIVKTKREAFQRYLGIGKPAYVSRVDISPIQAIELILAAQGVPVLAHPGSSNLNANFIAELVAAGLQGLEVHHRDHSAKQVKLYTKIATRNNLLITGGSDFHGCHYGYYHPIGSCAVPNTVVEQLKQLASSNRL